MPARYTYRYVEAPRITWIQASAILGAAARGEEKTEISLDLCRSRSIVEIKGNRVLLGEAVVGLQDLRDLRRNIVYEASSGRLKPLERRSGGGYYKLRPVEPCGPPTIEINGIHMHRIEGTTPILDARAKIAALGVRPGSRVLDVCTGLGYTAIEALKRGAAEVTSIEVDATVLELAEHNPWSRELEDPRITILLGDASRIVEMLEGPYDYIVHDPPRFSGSTGSLYSQAFYAELYRLLRCGGRLFHYTGYPGRLRSRNLAGSVASRLRRAGFRVRPAEKALGVVGVKYC